MNRTAACRSFARLVAIAAIVAIAATLAAAPLHAAAAAAKPRRVTLLDDARFTAAADAALAELYDCDLAAARRDFAKIAAAYPAHPVGPLLGILPDWWEMLLDISNRSRDEKILAAMDEVVRRAEARLDRDPRDLDGRFFKAAALGFRGRIKSLRGEWIGAAWDGKHSLDLVRAVQKDMPENADLYFGIGLYDYFADVVPKRYAIFRPLAAFFPKGDKTRGLAELDRTMRQGRFARTEAGHFLVEIDLFFEKDYAASLRVLSWLRARHPDNTLFHVYEGRAHAMWGQWAKAAPVLDEVIARWQRHQQGYNDAQAMVALFYRARCDLATGHADLALQKLQLLETVAWRSGSRSNFRVQAVLQRGLAWDAMGKRPQAVAEYNRVLAQRDVAGTHAWAKKLLKQPYAWKGPAAIPPG